jgi:hypothetical protein
MHRAGRRNRTQTLFFILPGPERGGGRVGIVPWHQVRSSEGVAEFINSFVYGPSRFANVHEEVFAYPSDAVVAWGFWDLPEFFLRGGERTHWNQGSSRTAVRALLLKPEQQ